VFLIYGSKITAASRGFPATARLSCINGYGRAYATVLRLSSVVNLDLCLEVVSRSRRRQPLRLRSTFAKSQTVRDRDLVPKDH